MVDLPETISTERLHLIQMPLRFLSMSLEDASRADFLVDYHVFPSWYDETALIKIRIDQIQNDLCLSSWLLRAIVRRSDNQMIGHINAHGKPGMAHLNSYCDNGLEMGYTIYEPFRRAGYVCESIKGFIQIIPKPVSIVLSIGVNNIPSLKLASKLGFNLVDEIVDNVETKFVYLKQFS